MPHTPRASCYRRTFSLSTYIICSYLTHHNMMRMRFLLRLDLGNSQSALSKNAFQVACQISLWRNFSLHKSVSQLPLTSTP